MHAQATRRMSRDEINSLPAVSYSGPIHLVSTSADVPPATAQLAREPVLGFDTETRPAFERGRSFQPALLQLAGAESVYIFQLKQIAFPAALRRILACPDIVKAGVAVNHDIAQLQDLGKFAPQRFVDLGEIARQAGLKHHGLRGLAALLLGLRIPKHARTSNWEAPRLSAAQIKYAATDAWISRKLYFALDACCGTE